MSSRLRRIELRRLKLRARMRAERELDREFKAIEPGREKAGDVKALATTATTPIDAPLGISPQSPGWRSPIANVRINPDRLYVRRKSITEAPVRVDSQRGTVATVLDSSGNAWGGKPRPDGTIPAVYTVPLKVKVRCNSRGLREFKRFCAYYEIGLEQLDTDLWLCFTLGGEDESRLRNHPSVLAVDTMINADRTSRAQGQSPKK